MRTKIENYENDTFYLFSSPSFIIHSVEWKRRKKPSERKRNKKSGSCIGRDNLILNAYLEGVINILDIQ